MKIAHIIWSSNSTSEYFSSDIMHVWNVKCHVRYSLVYNSKENNLNINHWGNWSKCFIHTMDYYYIVARKNRKLFMNWHGKYLYIVMWKKARCRTEHVYNMQHSLTGRGDQASTSWKQLPQLTVVGEFGECHSIPRVLQNLQPVVWHHIVGANEPNSQSDHESHASQSQKAEQHLERIQRSYQKHHVIWASVKSNEWNCMKVEWDQRDEVFG